MPSLNRVLLIGRLTRDPELKYTSSGVAVCNFTIAVDRSYGKGDEKGTDFIRIDCWRNLAETCAKFLNKGRQVFVTGRLQTRSYEAQDGSKRNAWEIVARDVQFIGKPAENKGGDGEFDMDGMMPC